jgi:hypothetical protein
MLLLLLLLLLLLSTVRPFKIKILKLGTTTDLHRPLKNTKLSRSKQLIKFFTNSFSWPIRVLPLCYNVQFAEPVPFTHYVRTTLVYTQSKMLYDSLTTNTLF